MKQSKPYIVGLCLSLWACGPNTQMTSQTSHLASSESQPSAEGAPVSSGPTTTGIKSETPQQNVKEPIKDKDMVAAPIPVSGTFLAAKILDEETVFVDSIKVGIAVYKDGMRVASQGQRFAFEINLDEIVSPDVKVRKDLISSTRAEFDKEIRVYGNSLAEIKAAFPFIMVKTRVDDRQLNITSNKTESLQDLLKK